MYIIFTFYILDTALDLAALNDCETSAEALLTSKANICNRNHLGCKILIFQLIWIVSIVHSLAQEGKLDMITLFLNFDFDINFKDANGSN